MKFRSTKSPPAADDAASSTATATATATKDEKEKAPPVGNYWRIISFGSPKEHLCLVFAFICAVGSGIPLPLMNIVFGHLAADFTGYFIPGSGVSEGEFKSSVNKNSLFIVYLFVGKFVLTYGGMFFFRIVSLRISAALRLSYMEALFRQPIKKLDEVSAGTVANTITTSANSIQLSISERLHALFQALALIVAAYVIAFIYSWNLTLVASSTLLFALIVYGILTPFTLKALKRVETADEKHATVAAEAVSSIRTVYALGAESRLVDKHTRWVNEADKAGMRLAPQMALQLSPQFFAMYACFALAFWYGLELYQHGHIANVGTVIVVFFSVLVVVGVLGSVVQPLMFISKAIAASGNFFDMIDAERVKSGGLTEPEVSAEGDIELRNIGFSYPTRPGVQVLQDFSAVFPAGKTTALVGPSGSGKSTVVGLLERWYELSDEIPRQGDENVNDPEKEGGDLDSPTEEHAPRANHGSIYVGGHDISTFDLKWWRSRIGLVQQEPILFNDTIERNVAYGLTGTQWENVSEAEKLELVKDACKEAYADDFIRKLSKGYSTLVGEGGIKLSGGQRQRIAIARSIIRKPSILILDEATSAIDVQGERIVQEALDRVSKHRTTIMIAHRLSTIRKADHIIVLRNGTKIEEGTHEELLSIEEGLYKGLVQAQALTKDSTDPEEPANDLVPALSRQFSDAEPVKAVSTVGSEVNDMEEGTHGQWKRKSFFTTVGLLLYEQRNHWLWYVIVLGAGMAAGSANALQSYFLSNLINAFTYTGQRLRDAQSHWALMFFILAIAVTLVYGILGYGTTIISTYVGTKCKKEYFKDTLKMEIPFFDRQENSSGSLMSMLSGDPKQIQELLGFNSIFPLISVCSVIGCIIIALYFGWKLSLVAIFAVMPIIIGGSFARVRYDFKFEEMNTKVFSGSSQFATEAIGAFRTVSSLTMEDSIVEKYRVLLQEQVSKSTKKAMYAMLVYAFTDSVELLGMALTFWYGGQLLASREYQPIQFFVIYAAIIQGAQAAGQYLSVTVNVAKATDSSNRILALRYKAQNIETTAVSKELSTTTGIGAKITFQNVSFHYAENTAPLFSNLNITIEAGQFVACVGPSGCGKTTIISLLERFYQPSTGTISLDDTDINTLGIASYRRDLALVSQEPRLFSGNIRQNLLLGVDESSVTEEEIVQACRDAEIHDFITSLPESYATELGLNTQTALSGGQKQRLCLARALLRKPKLLLLDEATSSLDSQSEKLVQGAIERLAGSRSMTVIAVAHRLATIQKADVIFVFGERDTEGKKGSKIVEKGSHGALLARKGVYWSMCQAQALDA